MNKLLVFLRDLTRTVKCNHGRRPHRCFICMTKINGTAFDRVLFLLDDPTADRTQAILNIVFDEMERKK